MREYAGNFPELANFLFAAKGGRFPPTHLPPKLLEPLAPAMNRELVNAERIK